MSLHLQAGTGGGSMRSGIYKTNVRGNREYTLENAFGKGIHFSNSPLAEGEVRLMNNFRLSDDRLTLIPREGYSISGSLDTTLPEGARFQTAFTAYTGNQAKSVYLYRKGNKLYGVSDTGTTKEFTPTLSVQSLPASEIHGLPINIQDQAFPSGVSAYGDRYIFRSTDGLYQIKSDLSCTKIDPKNISATMAASTGYNMLKDNPYYFEDASRPANAPPALEGILPYKAYSDEIYLNPKLNDTVKFRCNVMWPENLDCLAVWEVRYSTEDSWQAVEAKRYKPTASNTELSYTMKIPSEQVFLRASLYMMTDVTSLPNSTDAWTTAMVYNFGNQYYVKDVDYSGETVKYIAKRITPSELVTGVPTMASLSTAFDFNTDSNDSIANLEMKNYNLKNATGISYWNNAVILYGVPEDPSMLFMSGYNEPEYFPYPNNIDSFDEPIRYVCNYLSDLLVFTESKLWRLTRNTQGAGWTKSLIQGNLNIGDYDYRFIQVVKNMVYFKSGDGYYMVVPKAQSTTGELTLAPVSRSINGFFRDFRSNLVELLQMTYGYSLGGIIFSGAVYNLQDAYAYLDFEDVHNVFAFQIQHGDLTENLCLDVMYNTVARYWHIDTYDLTGYQPLHPVSADATRFGQMITLNQSKKLCFISRDKTPKDSLGSGIFKNWQYLDCGYHDYLIEKKKRFREIQFNINDLSERLLKFSLGFALDGEQRVQLYDYIATVSGDNIYLQRKDNELLRIEPSALLAASQEDPAWALGSSAFAHIRMWKVRTRISGKNYAPKFGLVSRNEEPFELVSYIWVYRTLYLR